MIHQLRKHPVLIPSSALLNAHHPVTPSPHPSPLQATLSLFPRVKSLLTVCLFLNFHLILFFIASYVHLFCFLNSTCEWSHDICPSLILLSTMPSSSIHFVRNGKISLFLWPSNIPLCVCARAHARITSLFICRYTCGLFPYFSYCGHCCYKHWGAHAPSNHCVCILWVNT